MAFFNTETTTEILLFSVDAILSLIVLKSYTRVNRYIKSLSEVSVTDDNHKIDDLSENKRKYAIIKGPVKALENSIPSTYVPGTSGVVQKTITNELVMKRTSSGFWWDESRPIHQSYNVVPFAIIVDKHLVQVEDVLMADELHLDTVYNKYETSAHTLAGNLWSLFFGVRRYGIQTTEEMLKEGTVITGVGDLLKASDGSKSLVPPCGGKPFFITTQPLSTLLRDLRDKRFIYGTILLITGSLTLLFGSALTRRIWKIVQDRRQKREIQRRLEQERKARRQNVRDEDLPDTLRCVVCQENPKEIIMLPCGHLCACEDCSEQLGTSCPICRSYVQTKAAAFF